MKWFFMYTRESVTCTFSGHNIISAWLLGTWEMRSWQAASSFSFSSIFLLLSDWVLSSCLQRFTMVFTSDFILLMYRRATVNSSSIMPLPPSCCWKDRRGKLKRDDHIQEEETDIMLHKYHRYNILWKDSILSSIKIIPTSRSSSSTLMSLLPTAMPISARSLSSEDIISVTLFLWWLDISFSFWSSESREDRIDCREREYVLSLSMFHYRFNGQKLTRQQCGSRE